MIKPDKIPARGKLRATPQYCGLRCFSMFRSLGQFSCHESHGICDLLAQGFCYCFFYYFCVWTEE